MLNKQKKNWTMKEMEGSVIKVKTANNHARPKRTIILLYDANILNELEAVSEVSFLLIFPMVWRTST